MWGWLAPCLKLSQHLLCLPVKVQPPQHNWQSLPWSGSCLLLQPQLQPFPSFIMNFQINKQLPQTWKASIFPSGVLAGALRIGSSSLDPLGKYSFICQHSPWRSASKSLPTHPWHPPPVSCYCVQRFAPSVVVVTMWSSKMPALSRFYVSVAHLYRLKANTGPGTKYMVIWVTVTMGSDKRKWREGERIKRAIRDGISRSWEFMGRGGLGS